MFNLYSSSELHPRLYSALNNNKFTSQLFKDVSDLNVLKKDYEMKLARSNSTLFIDLVCLKKSNLNYSNTARIITKISIA